MNKVLKPCPFCGSVPKTSHRAESKAAGGGHVAFVVCYCGGYSSTAHQMGHAETVEVAVADVIKKWNRRAQPAEAEGVEFPIARFLDHKREGAEWMVRAVDHAAALSAVTAERDRLLADRDDCLEARQYYADKCREVTAERDRIRAYVEAMRVDALPDGFVAVPTEPTEEMLTAYSTNPAHVASACAIYRAMISARPDAYAALAAKEE